MKIELIVFAITIFFIMNTYNDGHYVKVVKSWKKYYQMAGIGFVGLSAYLFMRKHPDHSRSLLTHANGLLKYLPIDKEASDLLTPLLSMGQQTQGIQGMMSPHTQSMSPQEKRLLNSGQKATKRSVSETKKKYVAAQQGWNCGACKKQLPAWFEVDHKIRLDNGGSNNVDNLVALCRDCHGKKTAFENL